MTAIQTRQSALAALILAGAACASVARTLRPEAAFPWLTGMLSALADGAVRCGLEPPTPDADTPGLETLREL
jgi:hypothetical protein